MHSILFIASAENRQTDNLGRLSNAFESCSWDVSHAEPANIWFRNRTLQTRLSTGQVANLASFDWIWVIGFGSRATFLDRLQLLNGLDASTFINTPNALLHLQNKGVFEFTSLSTYLPQSVISDDAELLGGEIAGGGDWFVKPVAGSFGRGVFSVSSETPNYPTILELLVRDGHVLLQREVPAEHEKRWFLAQGKVLGVYRKRKFGKLGNLRKGSVPELTEPPVSELKHAEGIAYELAGLGIRACAVDIAYPYLLDVNFVNPGWFQSMERLTGEDLSLRLPELFEN